jgi:hypothetical protein
MWAAPKWAMLDGPKEGLPQLLGSRPSPEHIYIHIYIYIYRQEVVYYLGLLIFEVILCEWFQKKYLIFLKNHIVNILIKIKK